MSKYDGEELQVGEDVKEIFDGIMSDPAEAVAEEAAAEAEAVAEEAAAEAEAVAEEAVAEATVEPSAYDGYGTETVTYTEPAPAPAFDYGYSASQTDYTAAPSYTYNQPQSTGGEGLAITGMILGIVAFVFNPIYIVSILAIVFGAIGLKSSKKGMATAGLICGIASFVGQLTFDVVFTILTLGGGIFSCCI